jgi:hypothetical protein
MSFLLEDLVDQVVVLARVGAVDVVVGAHHGAGVRLLDRGLEVRQVDLAQRALVDLLVDEHPVALDRRRPERLARSAGVRQRRGALLVVGGEVLDVGDHALRLQPADPADRHLGIEVRVLAVGLKGAPAQRRAHDVDRRPEDDVVALVAGLVADHRAVGDGQPAVEGRGERHRDRHRGRLALARADRAVAEEHLRDVEPRHAVLGAGMRTAVARAHAGEVVSGEQPDLLVGRERLQQEPSTCVGAQGRVAPRMAATATRPMGARREQHDGSRGQQTQHTPAHGPEPRG